MIKKLLPLDSSWKRDKPIDSLIFHTTLGTSALSSWKHLDKIGLSYHYIIDANGDIYQSAELDRETWHAGKIKNPIKRVLLHFKGINPNELSVGIAFSRNGHKKLTQLQVKACIKLIKTNNWESLPFFSHHDITSYKPEEVDDYIAQIKEGLKGEDFKINLMKSIIQLLLQLIGELKK